MGFVHLHTHSEYSPLDSIARVGDLVDAAVADSQPAMAITDHGNLAGTYVFAQKAAAAGITPILGIEAYLAIGSRHERNTAEVPRDDIDTDAGAETDKSGTKTKKYEHIVLLARNQAGWKNLLRIHNASQHSRFGKLYPRVDYELIAEHSDGIIILTGCLGGPVLGPMSHGKRKKAAKNLDKMIAAVGAENVYVEIMEHGIESESMILPDVVELARSKGVKCVATNDSHYVNPQDAYAHGLWLAKGAHTSVKDTNRWQFHGDGYHLRTEAEMRSLRPESWWAEACDETVRLAERIEPSVIPPNTHLRLPRFTVPDEFLVEQGLTALRDDESLDADERENRRALRSQKYFFHLVKQGAYERYGNPYSDEVASRLNREAGVIKSMGLIDYFLIVHEMIAWARSRGIAVGPGRGSAAGACVAYVLDITQVEPLSNGLLFERFLDPTRIGMPDIDVDFEKDRRDEVIQHLREVYGEDMVARIGTNMVSKAKASVRNAGQVLAIHSELTDKLAAAMPMDGVSAYTFAKLDATRDTDARNFWNLVESDTRYVEMIEIARSFEDVSAGQSVHACGVIISDEPLTDLIPMRMDTNGSENDPLVSEWEAGPLEKGVGLLKMDVLGLKNLDIATRALATINRLTGQSLTIDDIPHPDDIGDQRVRDAYTLISEGRTQSVFQLSGGGMQELARSVAPSSLNDLSALVALYRPGPLTANMHTSYAERKNGQESVDYGIFTDNPTEQQAIAGVLGSTFGLTVYQEQAMQLGQAIAGFGVQNTNRLRVAISKKKQEEFPELERLFISGATSSTDDDGNTKMSFAKETAKRLWHTIEGAAAYAFNRCLTGDTRLTFSDGSTATISALHHRLYGTERRDDSLCWFCHEHEVQEDTTHACAPCQQWRHAPNLSLMAYDTAAHVFAPQDAVAVHFNGVHKVYLVMLAGGRFIRATGNHRFMQPDGTYIQVRHMVAGHTELLTDCGPERVLNVSSDGLEPVYDVEMAPGSDHNFLANGIVSHNSHSAAYGQLSYITAYLKAMNPAAYGAAVLAVTSDNDRRSAILHSLREENVTVSAPDINESLFETTAVDSQTIIFGLGEIRDVGNAAKTILVAREDGPFTSLADLVQRVGAIDDPEMPKVNSKVLAGLVESGALDSFGSRRAHFRVLRALDDHPDTPILDDEWGVVQRAIRQQERLGLILDEHPMVSIRDQVKGWRPHIVDRYGRPRSSTPVPVHHVGTRGESYATTIGIITSWSVTTRGTRQWATMTLEGAKGRFDAKVWSNTLDSLPESIGVGSVVGVGLNIKKRVLQREVEEVNEDGELVTITRDETFVNISADSFEELTYEDVGEITPTVHISTSMFRHRPPLPSAPERPEPTPATVESRAHISDEPTVQDIPFMMPDASPTEPVFTGEDVNYGQLDNEGTPAPSAESDYVPMDDVDDLFTAPTPQRELKVVRTVEETSAASVTEPADSPGTVDEIDVAGEFSVPCVRIRFMDWFDDVADGFNDIESERYGLWTRPATFTEQDYPQIVRAWARDFSDFVILAYPDGDNQRMTAEEVRRILAHGGADHWDTSHPHWWVLQGKARH